MEKLDPIVSVMELTPDLASTLLGWGDPAKAKWRLVATYRVDLCRGAGLTESGNYVVWNKEGRRITVERFDAGVPARRFRFCYAYVDPERPEPHSWLAKMADPCQWMEQRFQNVL